MTANPGRTTARRSQTRADLDAMQVVAASGCQSKGTCPRKYQGSGPTGGHPSPSEPPAQPNHPPTAVETDRQGLGHVIQPSASHVRQPLSRQTPGGSTAPGLAAAALAGDLRQPVDTEPSART